MTDASEQYSAADMATAAAQGFRDGHAAALAELRDGGVSVEPVGYMAWRDGKPAWDEDCVCQDAVYPTDDDDDRTSEAIYTLPQIAAAQLQDRQAAALGLAWSALKEAAYTTTNCDVLSQCEAALVAIDAAMAQGEKP